MTSTLRRIKIKSLTDEMTDAITAAEQAFEAAGKPLAYRIIQGHGGISTYDIIYDVADSLLAAPIVAARAKPVNFEIIDGVDSAVVPDVDDPAVIKETAETALAATEKAKKDRQDAIVDDQQDDAVTKIKAHKLNTLTDDQVDALSAQAALALLARLNARLDLIYEYLMDTGTAVTDDAIETANALSIGQLMGQLKKKEPK